MPDQHERACIRGCTQRDQHYATCADYGREDGTCKGCAPRVARDGSLLCGRCFGRLRRNLDQAPDLLGLLRTRADPMKAQLYDKVMVSGSLHEITSAPVQVDVVDAGDEIIRGLREWARFAVTGEHRASRGLWPGQSAADAFDDAEAAASEILQRLPELANDSHQIGALCAFVIDQWLPGEEHYDLDERGWTIARALQRWPLADRAWWAAQPCPYCDLRAIRVTPPRIMPGVQTYHCHGCGWERDDNDTDADWPAMFSKTTSKTPAPTLEEAA